MTVKTDISRFDIHDELAAPEESAKILRGIQSAGGTISKLVGVLAGAPRVLRAYARMRSELRNGRLSRPTRERIALAVAEHRGDTYSISQHVRTARDAGLGLDEVSRARSFNSADQREQALLTYLKALLDSNGRPDVHLHEQAREIGWTDEELLEAIANLALNELQSFVANAAALPVDQTDPKVLPTAA